MRVNQLKIYPTLESGGFLVSMVSGPDPDFSTDSAIHLR